MELILEYTDTQKAKVFNILRTNKMMILLDNKCILISHLSTSIEESITSNQEETDTKIILHNHQILKSNEASIKIMKRSPLGDTDIIVLTVALLYEFHNKALIDAGSEDNRKVMRLRNIDIGKGLVNALIGFTRLQGIITFHHFS